MNLSFSDFSFKYYIEYFFVTAISTKMKIIDSQAGTICKKGIETIIHFFLLNVLLLKKSNNYSGLFDTFFK